MRSHAAASVLQYVELYSLFVIPAVEHANEAVSLCVWDETAATIVRVGNKKRPGHKVPYDIRRLQRNDDPLHAESVLVRTSMNKWLY